MNRHQIILIAVLLFLSLTAFSFISLTKTVSATVCYTQNTNPRAGGLISAPILSTNFGNPTGQCVVSNQAVFVPFKIPTFADLLSLYFEQSKFPSDQKITLTGNQTQGTNSPINIQGSAGPGVVTFDSASSDSVQASSLSWSHTIGAGGSNRFLLVGISIRDSNPPDTVSSATFAGQNLTFIGRKSYNRDASIEMWYLLNPPTGTNTVTVTLTGTADLVGGATSWTGVNQASPLGTFASAGGGFNTTPSVEVSSTAGEVVVDVATRPDSCVGNNTVGPGQTQRWNRCQTPGDTRGLGSSESGASTVTMSWTIGSEVWAIGAVPIKPTFAALEKIYYITGDLTVPVGSSITVDKTGIIFTDGNLTINTNLTYTNENAGLVFIAQGDIIINPSVTRIDAVLIASGHIYTAGANCSHNTPVTASQLIINGSLISLTSNNNIEFCRNLSNNNNPAEVINQQPKYLVILKDLFADTLQKWSEI